MGIFSAVAKVATRIVKAVTKSGGGSAAKAVQKSSGSIWSGVKSVAKSVVGGNGLASRAVSKLTKAASKPSLWKSVTNAASKLWKPLAKYGSKALKIGTKLCKRIPVVGTVITLAVELPNIYKGYKKEGWKGALKQVGGAGIELGCMAAGAAIGSVVPGVGTAIGAVVGGLIGWGIRAFTLPEPDDDDEAEAPKANEKQEAQAPKKEEVKPKETEKPSPSEPVTETPVQKPTTPTKPTTPVDNGVEIPDEDEGSDEIEDTEETDITTGDNAEVTYTKDEIERLLALGMSRKQIKLLMENGFTYRDVEMALITSMLEDSQGTANPFSTEAKSNKSSLKLVG